MKELIDFIFIYVVFKRATINIMLDQMKEPENLVANVVLGIVF